MILGQIVLLAGVATIAVYFLKHRQKTVAKALKKIALLCFLLISVLTIIFPNILSQVASFLGIGRGADLLLYGLALVVLFQLFNNYMKDREYKYETANIIRKLAILEADRENGRKQGR